VRDNGGLAAVEGLLQPSLLLGLEERMVLERIGGFVALDRELRLERGVPLLQLEVLLNRLCK
jgi:hypothetical protein